MNEWILDFDQLIERAINQWAQGVPRGVRADLRQDCYCRLLEQKKRIQQKTAELDDLETEKYISTVLKNRVLNLVKKNSKLPMSLEGLDEQPKARTEGNFVAMLEGLDPVEQEVLTLIFRDQEPTAKIAKMYGCGQQWISKIKARAIQKLREQETK
jgi:RNA polymerase sigma factor (sigma-70 family)